MLKEIEELIRTKLPTVECGVIREELDRLYDMEKLHLENIDVLNTKNKELKELKYLNHQAHHLAQDQKTLADNTEKLRVEIMQFECDKKVNEVIASCAQLRVDDHKEMFGTVFKFMRNKTDYNISLGESLPGLSNGTKL